VDSPKINPGVSLRVGGSRVDKRSEKQKQKNNCRFKRLYNYK
jgi:hypothetical protein